MYQETKKPPYLVVFSGFLPQYIGVAEKEGLYHIAKNALFLILFYQKSVKNSIKNHKKATKNIKMYQKMYQKCP